MAHLYSSAPSATRAAAPRPRPRSVSAVSERVSQRQAQLFGGRGSAFTSPDSPRARRTPVPEAHGEARARRLIPVRVQSQPPLGAAKASAAAGAAAAAACRSREVYVYPWPMAQLQPLPRPKPRLDIAGSHSSADAHDAAPTASVLRPAMSAAAKTASDAAQKPATVRDEVRDAAPTMTVLPSPPAAAAEILAQDAAQSEASAEAPAGAAAEAEKAQVEVQALEDEELDVTRRCSSSRGEDPGAVLAKAAGAAKSLDAPLSQEAIGSGSVEDWSLERLAQALAQRQKEALAPFESTAASEPDLAEVESERSGGGRERTVSLPDLEPMVRLLDAMQRLSSEAKERAEEAERLQRLIEELDLRHADLELSESRRQTSRAHRRRQPPLLRRLWRASLRLLKRGRKAAPGSSSVKTTATPPATAAAAGGA
eukprot:TRINITY_DN4020_c0_g1_i1.p1 TRINITY_DN4020_c0_g1~~TRINITY_DN4020_c0_g1_i1.p1  ORF type:complete len:426 (+),score=134.55 TRINITY_DN4020_c0_g1_i1:132-1409(+)